MKKRNYKEENHYYVQWSIAAFILLIYVAATLMSYSNSMKEQAKERVLDRITRQAMEIKGFYEGTLNCNEDFMVGLGKNISESEDIFSEEVVAQIEAIAKAKSFKRVYVVKKNGSAIDNKGTTYKVVDNSEKFMEMLDGNRNFCIITDADGDTVIAQSVPIQSNAEIKGQLIYEYIANGMSSVIDVPIFGYAFVFEDGLVAETMGDSQFFKVGDNVLGMIKDMTFKEGSYTTVNQALTGGRSTSALISNNQDEYYIVTQPISNSDGVIVLSAKKSVIEKNISDENASTKGMVLKLMISLAVFIILIAIIYVINRLKYSKTSMELQNKAETDLLTDLLNKISTEKKIKEYIAEEGKDKTCMMCVLDIDNFKKINDTMGHAFGDEVLAALGKQIRSEFRVSDIIGRTGGDEFIIFLKDLKEDSIIKKESERVETFFKNFTVGEYTKYSATASIGAAIYPRDASDFESLYKAADTALYKAKNRGKNQLAFYKDLQD